MFERRRDVKVESWFTPFRLGLRWSALKRDYVSLSVFEPFIGLPEWGVILDWRIVALKVHNRRVCIIILHVKQNICYQNFKSHVVPKTLFQSIYFKKNVWIMSQQPYNTKIFPKFEPRSWNNWCFAFWLCYQHQITWILHTGGAWSSDEFMWKK